MQLLDSYFINKDTLGCPWAVLLLPPILQIWGVRTASGTTGTTWGVLVKLLDMLMLCMTRTTGQPVCIHLLYSLTHHRRPRAPRHLHQPQETPRSIAGRYFFHTERKHFSQNPFIISELVFTFNQCCALNEGTSLAEKYQSKLCILLNLCLTQ